MLYSKMTRSFYSHDVHGTDVPEDSVEIDSEAYLRLLAGQSEGKVISPDESGRPVLVDPPIPSDKDLVAMFVATRDGLLRSATERIAPLQDAVDLDDATEADLDALKKWKQYRVSLNRLQDQPGFPGEITWPRQPG